MAAGDMGAHVERVQCGVTTCQHARRTDWRHTQPTTNNYHKQHSTPPTNTNSNSTTNPPMTILPPGSHSPGSMLLTHRAPPRNPANSCCSCCTCASLSLNCSSLSATCWRSSCTCCCSWAIAAWSAASCSLWRCRRARMHTGLLSHNSCTCRQIGPCVNMKGTGQQPTEWQQARAAPQCKKAGRPDITTRCVSVHHAHAKLRKQWTAEGDSTSARRLHSSHRKQHPPSPHPP